MNSTNSAIYQSMHEVNDNDSPEHNSIQWSKALQSMIHGADYGDGLDDSVLC